MILDWDYIHYRTEQNIIACLLLAEEKDQKMMIEMLCSESFKCSGPKLVFKFIRNLSRAGHPVTVSTVSKASRFYSGHLTEWCSRINDRPYKYREVFADAMGVEYDSWKETGEARDEEDDEE